ncbi:hypothetical protein CJI59_02720 [Streptomyces sp. Alain-F2R5]|jgi:hypothetical protein|uniref:DUF6278 family protein n=1 Tax=Streptomyces TaxID=1883 RepID=UPI000A22F4A5|nr:MULTISPECIES: DUF6278 family protein [unclassified Streptomyces]MDG9694836.1 DUF6278 family protein [Streptomyces sp. DH17]OSC64273.1 hypothetical protein B5181_20775 [Streptomyces sp. 4F]MDN3244675.1 DUF6278 family protein [Streptomyces sp. ZSW22]MDN3252656.1 DUF6278 family protein [Streptomyces sp. MA25(2023)]PAK27726.1 hypothetical protein CJD44_02250 [Streptomyces sp. alain-838]
MNFPFLGRRRADPRAHDAEGIGDLLADCDLLRSQALREGVRLDDSEVSLERLDQMLPRWRGDDEILDWLGNDAGLYLGTVIVRTVPGAVWSIRSDGQPVVRLASGREFDVVASGHAWAADGAPELSQVYGEVAEA